MPRVDFDQKAFKVTSSHATRSRLPGMGIINSPNNWMAQHWKSNVIIRGDGALFQWRNTAKVRGGKPLAWFLAHGTSKGGKPLMQAHGPWTFAVRYYMAAIDNVWKQETERAWHIAQQKQAANNQIKGDAI